MSLLLSPAPLPAWIAFGFLALGTLGAWGWRPDLVTPDKPTSFGQRQPEQTPAKPLAESQAEPPREAKPDPKPAPLGRVTRLKPREVHSWARYRDGSTPRSYQIGAVKLTFSSDGDTAEEREEADGLRITLRAPGVRTAVLYPPDTAAVADFRVGRIDPGRPEPQVLILAHSLNMRCCDDLYLASPRHGEWRFEQVLMVDDEDPFEPADRDGDGVPEIVTRDFSFLFAFCEYLCSFPPPAVYQIENGRPVDVSHRRAFRKMFEKEMSDLTARCREKINAACASMVAVASRLGRRKKAWKLMLSNYDPADKYELPSWCRMDRSEAECPKGKLERYETFPDALAAFLKHEGYG